MSGTVQRFVRRVWAGEAGFVGTVFSVAAAPVAGGLRAAVAARNWRYDHREAMRVPGIRVVCVGNLAVGGTGKTPISAWVARYAASQGHTPALVTRGYGRDEPLLHARWNPDIPVVVGADREHATRRAAAGGATVAVLDDGFQHRRLHRDVDVVLLAAEDTFPGHLMPWGPYREPGKALGRAHAVVVTRKTADAERAQALARRIADEHAHLAVARVHLAPGGWQDLEGRAAEAPAGPVLAATGIARPADFAATLAASLDGAVDLVSLADHHEFTRRDVEQLAGRADGRCIVVSEKDAVKLTAFSPLLPDARVLTLEVLWEGGEELIRRLVRGAGRGERPS